MKNPDYYKNEIVQQNGGCLFRESSGPLMTQTSSNDTKRILTQGTPVPGTKPQSLFPNKPKLRIHYYRENTDSDETESYTANDMETAQRVLR